MIAISPPWFVAGGILATALAQVLLKQSSHHGVLSAAWDVAAKARGNSSLTDEDLKTLFAEIAKSDSYKDRYDKDEPYDGV